MKLYKSIDYFTKLSGVFKKELKNKDRAKLVKGTTQLSGNLYAKEKRRNNYSCTPQVL